MNAAPSPRAASDSDPHALVGVTLEGSIRIIELRRPAKRNALTPGMLDLLIEAFTRRDAARVILLQGQGSSFCAGFDLDLCRAHPDGSVMRQLLIGLASAIRVARGLDTPIVLAAHGAAIAGGCALLGAADLVVTDANAKLGYPVLRIGVSPAVSAPYFSLGAGYGPARAAMLQPTLISGTHAAHLGLAHHCVASPDEVIPRARALALELAAKPPHAIAATRRWLHTLDRAAWPGDSAPDTALHTSLSLTGGVEERRMLAPNG